MNRRSWELLGFCAFLVLLLGVMLEVRHEAVLDLDAQPAMRTALPVAQTAFAAPADPPPPPPRIRAAYVGNTNTHRFHQRSCRHASCKNCTVRFASREEAIAAGYRPGGCCNP